MTDSTKMVDLPWVDGTTRVVPEWTRYERRSGHLVFARDGGFSYRNVAGGPINPHHDDSRAVRLFVEAPEPPVKVDVPTGIGAIVSGRLFADRPTFVLTRKGWRGLRTDVTLDSSRIANELRAGARVLYEGVDE